MPVSDEQLMMWARSWAKTFASKRRLLDMLEDLTQEAALGIMRARSDWDSEKTNFKTYAEIWARSYMQRYNHNMSGVVRSSASFTQRVEILDPETERQAHGWVDDRTEPAEAFDRVYRSQVASKIDDRTLAMVQHRIAGESLDTIGARFGISHERVRQLLVKATEVAQSMEAGTTTKRLRVGRSARRCAAPSSPKRSRREVLHR